MVRGKVDSRLTVQGTGKGRSTVSLHPKYLKLLIIDNTYTYKKLTEFPLFILLHGFQCLATFLYNEGHTLGIANSNASSASSALSTI
jgi:hypothetical protein